MDNTMDEVGDGDGDDNPTLDTGDGDGDGGDGDGDGGDGDGEGGDGDGDGGDADAGDGDGSPGDGDGDDGDGDGGDGDGDGLGVIMCGNKLYECGDTLDNDMDGLIDLDDPECTTPCDDDESSFQTNLPGQNEDCKSDCYFDGNSGSGDDKCEWNLQCDPENPGGQIGCAYNGSMCQAQVPKACLDACVPLVPNGCDCFGCCEIQGQMIYLDGSPDCSLNNLDACQSCTFNDMCPNPCEPANCEVCFGQDPDDLPPECMEPECPDGVTPCFDESECDDGEFCSTGCCVPIL